MLVFEMTTHKEVSVSQSSYISETVFTDLSKMKKIQMNSFERLLDTMVLDLIEFKIKEAKAERLHNSLTGTRISRFSQNELDSLDAFLDGIISTNEGKTNDEAQQQHGIQYNIFCDSIPHEDKYIRHTLATIEHIPFLNKYAVKKYGILPYSKSISYLEEENPFNQRRVVLSKIYEIPPAPVKEEATTVPLTVEPEIIKIIEDTKPKLGKGNEKFLHILSLYSEKPETAEYKLFNHLQEKPGDIFNIANHIKLNIIEKHNRLTNIAN